jgi:hypothetical protein
MLYLNRDLIDLIFKYLVKCCDCLKYTTVKNSDFCDKCIWYKRRNTHYCSNCSKRRLHFDMCHDFWTCMCGRCLTDEILGLMNRENFQ